MLFGSDCPVFTPFPSESAKFCHIKFISSLDGRNQSLNPPRVKLAQISAAVPFAVHPTSISIVF
jgi:hypothetical protein